MKIRDINDMFNPHLPDQTPLRIVNSWAEKEETHRFTGVLILPEFFGGTMYFISDVMYQDFDAWLKNLSPENQIEAIFHLSEITTTIEKWTITGENND